MKTSIDTREVVSIDVSGILIQGTYHKPRAVGETSRTAVVFLSPGILPRAATGDSAVYWADSVAASGYPTFRFDLPGLGDSDGDLPTKVIDFQCSVNEGRYATVVSEITRSVVDRWNFQGVVVIGLCAGAVTALYAAASDERIKGLILMDPYFYLQRDITSRSVLSHWQMRVMRKMEDDWQGSASAQHNVGLRLVLKLRGIQHKLRDVVLRARAGRLPSTANKPLIRCWNRVASSGRPMLVMSSSWSKPQGGAFDYLGHLLSASARRSRVDTEVIEGTTHNFAEGPGKAAVDRSIRQWLSRNFSLAGFEHGAAEVGQRSHGEDAPLVATA